MGFATNLGASIVSNTGLSYDPLGLGSKNDAMKQGSDTVHLLDMELRNIDAKGFCDDIEKLRSEVEGTANYDDFRHLRKIEWFGRLFSAFGFATAWIIPNPISAICIHMGILTRLGLLHAISHGGYDNVPGIPKRYTSRHFAIGWRRYVDFVEWWPAETWRRQHNELHHYQTGEESDPDTLERFGSFIRELRVPNFIKYILLFVSAITWKFTIYAPNSMSILNPKTKAWLKREEIKYITFKNILEFGNSNVRALWKSSYLPYITVHFVVVPLLFLPLGRTAVFFVLVNRLFAEIITNFHSALIIFPNHTGDDIYSIKFHYKDKEEFYVTQVMGTSDYKSESEFADYLSLWLNYQIEHHLFPRLPMQKYREIQPRVRALCEKHNVPYREESVFRRAWRTADFVTGKTDLRELWSFPRFDSERVPSSSPFGGHREQAPVSAP
jgi:fatty acid desaturase